MRAIWIDAVHRTVTEVDVTNLEDMQEKVGGLICIADENDDGDTVYVDDEGLLKNPQHFFFLRFCEHPFAGNGLIVGCDHETGESVDAKVPLEFIKHNIKFMGKLEVLLWAMAHDSKN